MKHKVRLIGRRFDARSTGEAVSCHCPAPAHTGRQPRHTLIDVRDPAYDQVTQAQGRRKTTEGIEKRRCGEDYGGRGLSELAVHIIKDA